MTDTPEIVERSDRTMLVKRHAILEWMSDQRKPEDMAPPPVLLSEMQRALGDRFCMAAFEGLRADGVIHAEFPEARAGDSGRQFWNFAHLTPIPPRRRNWTPSRTACRGWPSRIKGCSGVTRSSGLR